MSRDEASGNKHRQTPPQTIGPFFHSALMQGGVDELDPAGESGAPIVIEGAVFDGAGAVVSDAMIEVWQSDGTGRYRHPADDRSSEGFGSFVGFGRVASADDGHFRIRTVMPGAVPGRDGVTQAPHLNVHVFARGLLDQLSTRIYFEGVEANIDDPALTVVAAARRTTLLARQDGVVDGARRYRFDIVLQGEGETVFFDL